MWQLDPETDSSAWSDTAALAFGLPEGYTPPSGSAFMDLVHPDDRRLLTEQMSRMLEGGPDMATEFRAVWPDGSVHWIEAHARVFQGRDGRRQVLGTSTDVSDRKLLEDQLRQAQKMEAVGQLAGGVAHDFNNLLTAILGYANLLSAVLDPKDGYRDEVDEIVRAAERAASLTRQLLAFSRRQVLQAQVVDLNALVTGTSQMLRRLIGEHIELDTALAPDLAPVFVDSNQMVQIVLNLAVNSRDAMPSGGRLTIQTKNVVLDEAYVAQHAEATPGPYVMLAVTDTGFGMDEATRAHLFEPFFTTKEPGKGTGLGLATVYGIVKQSSGLIWVYSEPGRGTTFKIYLPVAKGSLGVAAPSAAETSVSTGAETVLLVEDERAVRLLTRIILERAGYRVIEAADAREAAGLFDDLGDSVHLLLTDVVMPGSTGPELYRSLSARAPGLRVLFMSGYTGDAIVRNGQLQPGMAFLEKPFTADGLARKVRQVLDQ